MKIKVQDAVASVWCVPMTAQFHFACTKVCLHVRPLDGTMQLFKWKDVFSSEEGVVHVGVLVLQDSTVRHTYKRSRGAFIFLCANMCSAFILPQVKSSSKVSDPSTCPWLIWVCVSVCVCVCPSLREEPSHWRLTERQNEDVTGEWICSNWQVCAR